MIWDGSPFGGAKLAAMHGDALLAYARDDKPGIPYPGMIDLPGGGREGDETPEDCVLRELAEEFGITLPAERLYYHRVYMLADGATVSHFFAVHLSEADVAGVKFGDGHAVVQKLILRRQLIGFELVGPIGVSHRRQGAGNDIPAGNRQA